MSWQDKSGQINLGRVRTGQARKVGYIRISLVKTGHARTNYVEPVVELVWETNVLGRTKNILNLRVFL